MTLATDEARAARAVSRAFAIARTRPRIRRMYLYQWRAGATDRFDAGLVRPDGTARASLGVVTRRLAAAVAGVPRVAAAWPGARRDRIAVRVTCRAAAGRCRGRVALALRTRTSAGTTGAGAWRSAPLGTRAYATTAARRTVTLTVPVPSALRRRARRAAARALRATVRPSVPSGAADSTVTVTLARPQA